MDIQRYLSSVNVRNLDNSNERDLNVMYLLYTEILRKSCWMNTGIRYYLVRVSNLSTNSNQYSWLKFSLLSFYPPHVGEPHY